MDDSRMSSNVPEISVLLPAYNAGLYLREAIDSILLQTFSDFELLIFNDGSTDNTHDIISSYKDVRIIYKRILNNHGYLNLLNEGLQSARGKYIARMDADDIALPTRFEEQYNYLEANKEIGICGSWSEFFGEMHGINKMPETFSQIQYTLFFGCPITHPTAMMRNDLLKKYSLSYNAAYYYTEDHYFFAEAAAHFKLVNLPTVLLKYRIHNTQIGSKQWKEQFRLRGIIQAHLFSKAMENVTEPDFQWLSNFFIENSKPDEQWHQDVLSYKKRILEGNEVRKVYPIPILEKAVNDLFGSKIKSNTYQYFFQKYYKRRDYNPRIMYHFLKEKYKPYKYLGSKLTFYFIVKCLLWHKKPTNIK